jgi:Domain of unknown function (DUF4833)
MPDTRSLSRRLLFFAALSAALALTDQGRASESKTLFVIARSKNANVVHYDVSLERDGQLKDEPVVAYWRMLAEDGRREELTWVERRFAYGFRITSKVSSQGFRMRPRAFEQREIAVRRGENGRYRAYLEIGGQRAILERIFVQTDTGTLPSVRFVELVGLDAQTGQRVSERLKP